MKIKRSVKINEAYSLSRLSLRMNYAYLVLIGIVLNCVLAEMPASIPHIIEYHFKKIDGSYLYFCLEKDAVRAFKHLIPRKSPMYNVHLLPKFHEIKEVLITFWQPQRLGIFLDMSCDEGYQFFNQHNNLFNGSYSWLLWSDKSDAMLESLFEDSRLSMDSDVTLLSPFLVFTDVYRIHVSSELIKTDIGTWADPNYKEIREKPKRTSFQGFVFNASLMMIDIEFNESNLVEPLLDKSYESGKDMVRRYGLSVFMHLAEYYNFSYNYVLTHAWGDPLPNGTWTGMVGQVARGEAEFGLAPAKYILDRYEIIDFVTSLHIVKVCFTFLQPMLFGSYKALVLPLNDIVWICLAVISIISIIVFRILSKHDSTGIANDSWGGSALLVVGAVSQQGIPDNTEKLSTRIVYLFLLFVSFFVATYYNTAILNGLLLPAPNAIQNLEALLKSDTKLAMLDIPYLRNEMLQNDTLTLRVREKIERSKPKKIFYSAFEGVAKMKKGQFALYTEDEAIYSEILHQMTDAQICSVSEVTKYNPFHVGVIAIKDSAYKEQFNRVFSLMRERGIMHRQLIHWTLKKPECQWRQDALTLGLEPLSLAFGVIVLGCVMSLVILILERLITKHFNKIVK